jgi:hypothetical protein
MTDYYVLDCAAPLQAEHYLLDVDYPASDKRWKAGVMFTDKDERAGFTPPEGVIELRTEADEPPRVYAELYWHPIPLMSRRLVKTLISAGVDNLQTYETRLLEAWGSPPPPEDYYLAVNIVGCVAAADLAQSKMNPAVSEKLVSADFYSLAIDPAKARDMYLFRLAENISAVIVHERIRKAVEAGGITTLTWYRPEEWAG